MAVTKRDIGDLLVDNGLITSDEYDLACREKAATGEPMSIILSRMGLANESHFKNALELEYGTTYISLAKREPDLQLTSLLPESIAATHKVVPVQKQGERILIAMVDPNDTQALEEVKTHLNGVPVKAGVCIEEDFLAFIALAYQKPKNYPGGSSPDGDADKAAADVDAKADSPAELEKTEPELEKAEAAPESPVDTLSENEPVAAPKNESVEKATTEISAEPTTGTTTESAKVEPAKDEPAKDEPAKAEPVKEEPTKEEAAKEESAAAEKPAVEAAPVPSGDAPKGVESSEGAPPGEPAKSDDINSLRQPTSEVPIITDDQLLNTTGAGPGYAPKADDDDLGEISLIKKAQEEAIVLLANQILGSAIKRHCSNIHIQQDEKQAVVHYRLNGALFVDRKLPKRVVTSLIARYKMMARLNLAERSMPQDGHIKVKSSSKEIVCLVTTVPGQHGENVVIWIV